MANGTSNDADVIAVDGGAKGERVRARRQPRRVQRPAAGRCSRGRTWVGLGRLASGRCRRRPRAVPPAAPSGAGSRAPQQPAWPASVAGSHACGTAPRPRPAPTLGPSSIASASSRRRQTGGYGLKQEAIHTDQSGIHLTSRASEGSTGGAIGTRRSRVPSFSRPQRSDAGTMLPASSWPRPSPPRASAGGPDGRIAALTSAKRDAAGGGEHADGRQREHGRRRRLGDDGDGARDLGSTRRTGCRRARSCQLLPYTPSSCGTPPSTRPATDLVHARFEGDEPAGQNRRARRRTARRRR